MGNIAEVYDGTHQTPDYKKSGIMFLSVENIQNLSSNKFISEEAFEKEFKVRPEKGDILMTRIGSIGIANVIEKDISMAYYVSLALIKSNFDPYFLKSNIHSPFVQDELWKKTLHIAFPKKINKNEIANVQIKFPSLVEQQKIGAFLKKLDNTIALHQRKLDNLKNLKKAYLQVMFPKIEENIPKVRFANFNDPWEQRELDDVAMKGKSYSLSRDVETFEYTGYKYVHYGDIHRKIADIITTKSNLPNINSGEYELLEDGDLILADASEDYQGIALPSLVAFVPNYKLVAGLHTIVLRPRKSILNSLFLYYLIHSPIFRRYGYRVGTGMKVFGISASNLMKFESLLPNLEEQKRISKFLYGLDANVVLHQKKLNLLKELKKGMLKKIFV